MVDIAKEFKWLRTRHNLFVSLYLLMWIWAIKPALDEEIKRNNEKNGGDTPKRGAL